MVPESGVAVAVLTNGGNAGPLIKGVIDPLVEELAAIALPPALSASDADARVTDHERYVGRYQSRPFVHVVTREETGRLWLTSSIRNEALTMEETAGVASDPDRHELRPAGGDIFVRTDSSGVAAGAVEFLGHDATGRARLLHTGRANTRDDA
jgi:hypothetical protein